MPDIANLFGQQEDDPMLLQSPGQAAMRGAARGAMGARGPRPMYGQIGGMAGGALGAFLGQRKKLNAQANMGTTYGGGGGDQNMQPMPEAQMESGDDGSSLMARGGIISKPTKILAGEHGPEAIVPLNNNPMNKVSTSILRRR